MPNRLAKEKSPYLLQHKDNPVDWYPWGEEAFERARKEKKLIFLSIGYSTCYWCHVMEKDSFELEEVATALNKDFVSIKVDREERPDVDKIYMEAVVAISGQGGWPMSVVLTPDLRPVFGGTFFYRAQFLQILSKLAELWKDSPETLRSNAEKVLEFLHQNSADLPAAELGGEIFDHALQELQQSFDKRFAGFGRAPKFPPSERLMVLLRIFHKTADGSALKMAKATLERMARGGMYDQLGGGFHRYSTDEQWLVPHFEKMLYDNAILAVTYLEGFQVTGDEMFASVARETLNYVLREMTDPKGGFLSAQDAGEVGKEGEFYVWKESELLSLLLPEEFDALAKVFSITPQGNFEHQTNVFSLLDDVRWSDRSSPLLRSAQQKLLLARSQRKRPHLDDKVLTSWNGLMIAAFAKGYQVLGDERYLSAAQRAATFIQQTLEKDGKLLHRYRDGNAALRATLDDYAFLIHGLLALYEADFDLHWIRWAEKLQAQLDRGFWDQAHGGYFFTDTEEQSLIVRKKDFSDEAIPSGNSIAALNLLKLYHLTFKKAYRDQADALLKAASGSLVGYPSAFASALVALDFRTSRVKEIVIVGSKDRPSAIELRDFVWREFLPNKIIASGEPAALEDLEAAAPFRGKALIDGKATFYICENNTCKLPTNDPKEARKLLAEK